MWQMDFKGDFALPSGRCYTLTVLDDHSRFNVCLQACANQRRATVQTHLLPVFATYGLPEAILVDNGPPWGSGYSRQPHTRFTAGS
jgi:transposase InsO family protein